MFRWLTHPQSLYISVYSVANNSLQKKKKKLWLAQTVFIFSVSEPLHNLVWVILTLRSFVYGFQGWGHVIQPVHVGICLFWQLLPSNKWNFAKIKQFTLGYGMHFLLPFKSWKAHLFFSILSIQDYMIGSHLLFAFSIIFLCYCVWDPLRLIFRS